MSSTFNEATRVQMPALVHLTRIGYKYFGKIYEESAGTVYDPDTNILIEVFKEQFAKLNPNKKDQADSVLSAIRQELDNNDIGEAFYKRLRNVTPHKLVDFDNPENNVYHCTAEFTCKNGEDNFRPDITLFINGLPLAFIEVKKPNNNGGMLAEAKRMNNQRFPNKKFRRFINITQLMIFSNNMEYDAEGGIVPIQGAFYCTGSNVYSPFNCFREENPLNLDIAPYNKDFPYKEIEPAVEKKIIEDFNNQAIHNTPEWYTNIGINTPTNRILTSMCSPERLLFLIKYGIAYYHQTKEADDGTIERIDQKHIIRYQQFFASQIIRDKIGKGERSGVVWHTQGSGKTALSYHLTYILSDYFAKQDIVTKFYFIVDRLDLLKQAKDEFKARGLDVQTANSRKELMDQFKDNKSQEGNKGLAQITVVNIQRFEENQEKVVLPSYATNLQRIFIIDEAHRGYKPEGSFLMNLFEADPNSIKIALTGTPLLKAEKSSWKVFERYYHTYYYDKSVRDGYTLKIIREDIETSYHEKLKDIYGKLEQLVEKKDIKKEDIISHPNYVKELLSYIIKDLTTFRDIMGDSSIGGMVICESSEQARRIIEYFDLIQHEVLPPEKAHLKAGLILHDSEDKETRDSIINDFKINYKIDILVVFNMLLTGFDAPRLKRLYFGRKLKEHGLLQALTRVNRPYKDLRYGYVIDFADIKQNFDETNKAYLKELKRFMDPDEVGNGNEIDLYAQVLEHKEEILDRARDAKQELFSFTLDNAEDFSNEINQISDKNELLKLRKALLEVRDCGNIIKTFGDTDLKETFKKIDIQKVKDLLSEVQRHIDLINQKENILGGDNTKRLIYDAMCDISFDFKRIGEDELKFIDGGQELNKKLRKVLQQFSNNIDPEDIEYITLREAFQQRFKEHGFMVSDMAEYDEVTKSLTDILDKLSALDRANNNLAKKYNGDKKFVRVHKRIMEENSKRVKQKQTEIISKYDEQIVESLKNIKNVIDQKVYDRNDILKKDAYFEKTVLTEISNGFSNLHINCPIDDRSFIQKHISKQYLEQYNETYSISGK